jgi:hypothetical protein
VGFWPQKWAFSKPKILVTKKKWAVTIFSEQKWAEISPNLSKISARFLTLL